MRIYHLSNAGITVRDVESDLAINPIILPTNEVVYNAMKKRQTSDLVCVKSDI